MLQKYNCVILQEFNTAQYNIYKTVLTLQYKSCHFMSNVTIYKS